VPSLSEEGFVLAGRKLDVRMCGRIERGGYMLRREPREQGIEGRRREKMADLEARRGIGAGKRSLKLWDGLNKWEGKEGVSQGLNLEGCSSLGREARERYRDAGQASLGHLRDGARITLIF
jgi:hypothetical protein